MTNARRGLAETAGGRHRHAPVRRLRVVNQRRRPATPARRGGMSTIHPALLNRDWPAGAGGIHPEPEIRH